MLSKRYIKLFEQYDYKLYLKDKYVDWAKQAEEAIAKGESNKEIYNVDFNDTKDHLKSILRKGGEVAIDATASSYNLSGDQKRSLASAFHSFIFDDFKKIEKETKDINDTYVQEIRRNFFSPLKGLYDRLLDLKPFIVKGRKPNPNAKPVYTPPSSSFSALADVKKVYDDLIKKLHPELVENSIKMDMDRADGLAESLPNLNYMQFSKMVDYELLGRHFVSTSTNHRDYKLKDEKERLQNAKRYAEDQAIKIEKQFIDKNLEKVTSLVGEKNNLKSAKAEKIRTVSGVLSGDIRFEFEDSSGFTIMNQLVSVWAYNKKPHYRFPSTFHDIIMPNGIKHKMKSEEWMNTVWVKGEI